MLRSLLLLITWLILLSGCAPVATETSASDSEKNIIQYAQCLALEKHQDYWLAKITGVDGAIVGKYALVPRERKLPTLSEDVIVVRTPVKSIVVNSEAYYNVLAELGDENSIGGVIDALYFKSPQIKANLENGRLKNVGTASQPSVEVLMQMKPDLVLTNIFEGMKQSDLAHQGINYLKLTDNLEPTPIGRAEWIKLFGVLTGRSAEADSIFTTVYKEYHKLKESVADIEIKPQLLAETMYEGVWYVPAGESYMATMYADAGAQYPWINTKGGGSLALGFENVYVKARNADVWLIRRLGGLTKNSLLADDKRYSQFKAFQQGNVYVADTEVSNIFEDLPFHPEKILHDYISILHPNVLPNHGMYYFKKITD